MSLAIGQEFREKWHGKIPGRIPPPPPSSSSPREIISEKESKAVSQLPREFQKSYKKKQEEPPEYANEPRWIECQPAGA